MLGQQRWVFLPRIAQEQMGHSYYDQGVELTAIVSCVFFLNESWQKVEHK